MVTSKSARPLPGWLSRAANSGCLVLQITPTTICMGIRQSKAYEIQPENRANGKRETNPSDTRITRTLARTPARGCLRFMRYEIIDYTCQKRPTESCCRQPLLD